MLVLHLFIKLTEIEQTPGREIQLQNCFLASRWTDFLPQRACPSCTHLYHPEVWAFGSGIEHHFLPCKHKHAQEERSQNVTRAPQVNDMRTVD